MCDKCNQTGYVQTRDTVDYWGATVSMYTTELCTCLESGICPGCEAVLEQPDPDDPDYYHCPNCDREFRVD